ncbi:helix-turn-helix domain-containing protein [Nocardia sp. NPDC050406]|uniref:helix-turn-helix domain-containing protein n=1 Tax=Nocardia sp. NPDC050406 TaxID=3364318 RepID=UPI00378B5B76
MATEWGRVRPNDSSKLLAAFAVEKAGVELPDLLRDTGLEPVDIRRIDGEVTLRQEITLVRNLLRATGDTPGTGARAGLFIDRVAVGVWGLALLTCPDVHDFVRLFAAFANGFAYARIRQERVSDGMDTVLDYRDMPEDVRRFMIERDITCSLKFIGSHLPELGPRTRVEVALPPDPTYDLFLDLHGSGAGPVHFGCPETRWFVDNPTLKKPMPQADPECSARYTQQCLDTIQARRRRRAVSGDVREQLLRHGVALTLGDMARRLHISQRTLRRRLADEGVTFRELKDETYGMLAEDLLSTGMPVNEVARRLGYSTPSAFAAAFKNWTGQSPRDWTRTQSAMAY